MSSGQYQPPGWYHGEGDPPGTKRYWDGELWVGEPQLMRDSPPPPSQSVPAPPRPGPAYQAAGMAYPEASQATTALVLGILGLVCCGLLGPFAWKTGNEEIHGIDSGRRDPNNRGMAVAGKVLGIVSSVILLISVLFLVLGVIGAVAGASEFA